MCSWRSAALVLLALGAAAAAQAQGAYAGIGRTATDKEIAAWDIDVRPDFKGLPRGQGTVAQGMEVWEAKCASCHGVFGEANQVFSPLVGGTTAEDIKTGRVARLRDPAFPGRTTLMKLSSVSTLWDYIRRAMPWNQPKSLSVDEVYAVTAYLLNLGSVVPEDFTLSDRNMAEVQQRLPNRNGVTTDHAMWPGRGLGHAARPDVKAAACMKDCAAETKIASMLPDHARDSHGNLAEQNRLVGSQRGIDTSSPAAAGAAPTAAKAAPAAPAASATRTAAAPQPTALLNQHGCVACHGVDSRIVGPAFTEIARKHGGRADAEAYLSGKIRAGGSGVWGAIPMPPQSLSEADASAIARWLAQLVRK